MTTDDDQERAELVVRELTDEELYIFSREDLEDQILPDVFVDLREEIGDTDAATCIDIVHECLIDDYYSHNPTDE